MSKVINIVLYDSDKDYIESLSEFLKGQNRKGVLFNFFTDASTLLDYCKAEVMDLIIIAEYLFTAPDTHNILSGFADKIIILGDEKEITHIDDFLCVYRFQRADFLISNILDICAEKVAQVRDNHRYLRKVKNKRIGFFSPVGRCGKTKSAIELAKKLTEEGYKVLLINLEEFSSFDWYLGSVSDYNISDLLFYFLSDGGCFEIKADAIIKNYKGFDYISPVKCIDDLRNIEFEVWESFISELISYRGYEIVIIEFSNMVKDYFKLLDTMDMVFSLYLDDEISRYKMKMYNDYIDISEYKELKQKILEIQVKDLRYVNIRDMDSKDTDNMDTDDNIIEVMFNRFKKYV